TVAKTDAGFFMDVSPVAVHELADAEGVKAAIVAALAQGNPKAAAPSRGAFPKPAVLEYAKVKTWSTFEQSALCGNISQKDGAYQLRPMRRSATRGWEDDPAKMETFSIEQGPGAIGRRMVELLKTAVV